jgi:hypothetical protein
MTTVTRDWSQPQLVTGLEVALGGKMDRLLPPRDVIPQEFTHRNNPYHKAAATWFFGGIDSAALQAKPGINRQQGLGHLASVLNSFEPEHDHKVAGVAYLMSLWFDLK